MLLHCLRVTTVPVLCISLLASCNGSSTDSGGNTSLPAEISAIMSKSRYASAKSQWTMVVMDARTGEVIYALEPDRLSFTGSVRKLFSVGMALNTLGAGHRFETPVYRNGSIDTQGVLTGDLVLVASGDLTFGGRTRADGSLDYKDFDHNEAIAFGGAGLTPENPLAAIEDLARQVRASGIERVSGDIVIDDRLFESFRVPNGNVLISPMLINENLIDVTFAPGAQIGQPAQPDWRPKTSAFTIKGNPVTVAANAAADISLSGDNANDSSLRCIGIVGCQGAISSMASLIAPATIPLDYKAPLIGSPDFVGVLRIEDPASFARIAFIDALMRAGVVVDASAITKNPTHKLPAASSYAIATRVGHFTSPPYSEYAKLILKVSLNTGANLSLMHAGLARGQRTVATALTAERTMLVNDIGLDPAGFDFPTNGSGSPDSRATPRMTAKLAAVMSTRPNYAAYRASLPLLGIDGSVASVGKNVPGKEHIAVKSGATVRNGEIAAISMAGYIDAKSGRTLAFALFVNDAGPLTAIEDTLEVFEDEAQIAGIIYDKN